MPFFDLNTVEPKTLVDGVEMKAVFGERIMMSFVDLEPGAHVPIHHHEHEQMGVVLSGEVELTIGDETKLCGPGDTYLMSAKTLHEARASQNGPAKVLDIFSPPREEYK